MLPLTVRAVCLNLLTFAYLAESFVLLTANVEDIKQIAKKFLSESLTDQISEIISKAKLQDALSEENERNLQENRNSGERETIDNPETYMFKGKPEELYNYQHNDENSNERYRHSFDRKQNLERFKHDKKVNDGRLRLKIDSAYVKRGTENEKKEANRFQIKGKNKNFPRMDHASSHPQQKKNRLTTQKHRNDEFDLYDNTNFERNELIATSGYLGLPRVKGFNDRKS